MKELSLSWSWNRFLPVEQLQIESKDYLYHSSPKQHQISDKQVTSLTLPSAKPLLLLLADLSVWPSELLSAWWAVDIQEQAHGDGLHRKSHTSLIIAALSSLLSWSVKTGSQIKDLAVVGTVALNWWEAT